MTLKNIDLYSVIVSTRNKRKISASCDVCNSDFEGIQPIFKHVPPNVLPFSMQQTECPSCAALIAQTYPAGPPPIIAISNFSNIKHPIKFYSDLLSFL